MSKRIVIFGAGPGGYVAAIRAAQLGAEVSVVEEDNVGGTCLNWGCIPSKIMITTAEMIERYRRAREFGLKIEGNIRPDMQQLMARKVRIIQDQTKGILDLFAHNKIHYLRGKGRIVGPGMAAVQSADGADGGILEVPWNKLILAPGTRPSDFPPFLFDGERILSSNHALSLLEVPESILILGGGVIGCEFAFLLSSLGSRVTVVEAMDRLLPLPSVDEDCSKILQREMKKRKIKFVLKRTAQALERSSTKLRVTLGFPPFMTELAGKEREPQIEEVDKILVCIGRKPNTAHLGLDKLGIQVDAQGWIVADDRMRTNVPDVFAIGDVLGPSKIMLAHVASAEGQIAAENAVGGDLKMAYDVVPGAIFTLPEVANVGLSESQARQQGFSVRAESVLFRSLGKAHVIGEIAGEAKIVSDAETGRVLGVHIVGPHATELIAEGALALRMGATVADLAGTIHAHPTLGEVMLEASLKSLGRSLHGKIIDS
ncbi:dihydrolipoamide dehydrogenase [Syntrophus gentianae]|uniref:Dihydrolipoyl dehydrogenase n=1 Tax=Syntrophus gentianae TaxID=43775 RepID=A0A1H7Y265_9BACT|nr:dihydrolipoyl dehydrogenase [Syntrophus gentianae]SEM40005.1 dihydrolipoamide dehydrogenase [Syntrophus gentianae]